MNLNSEKYSFFPEICCWFLKLVIAFIFLTSISHYARAEIYKWTDDNGVIHYSETEPEKIVAEEIIIKTYKSVLIENNNEQPSINNEVTQNKRSPQKVVMYSAEWCGVCRQAKAYFRKKNIRYTNYDIDKNKSARYRYESMGAKGVPVILVGNRRMNGFSVDGFEQLYRR